MGVKSTIRLTRHEAEKKAVDLYIETHRNKIRAQFVIMDDSELETVLEEMNDKRCGGQGFENYIIGVDFYG